MAFRNFFSKNKPKLVLICELETWPIFIASCYYRKIPVYLINSQITHEAMQRVGIITKLFGHPVELVSGVAAKSSEHAANFRSMGQRNVVPVGEFRFDQLIPQSHIKSGKAALSLINRRKRPVIGFFLKRKKSCMFLCLERLRYLMIFTRYLKLFRIASIDWNNIDVLLGDDPIFMGHII